MSLDGEPLERECDRLCLQAIFLSFFKVGAFTFGGGYAMLPVIENELVERRRWMNRKEFVDCLAIAQSGPGAIAVNTAIFTGYRMLGLTGALAATLGVVLPSFLIILGLAVTLNTVGTPPIVEQFFQGIRPAVVALIASAAHKLGRVVLLDRQCHIVAGLSLALTLLGVHPALIIVTAAVGGVLQARYYGWQVRRR